MDRRHAGAAVIVSHSGNLESLVGERSDSFQFVVERGKVREFALATKSQHPIYFNEPAPVIPPTFLASAAHWASHESDLMDRTGWDRRRMLHASQAYFFPTGPPDAGTALIGAARIQAAYERRGRRGGVLRFLVLETKFDGEDGAMVALAKTVVVETSQPPTAKAVPSTCPENAAVSPAHAGWTVGPVDVGDFVRYAGASGDFNRLHYDEAYARAAGFSSVFAQGMFNAGVLASYVVEWLGAREVRQFNARFVDVVWPGDMLTCGATMARRYVDRGEPRVDVNLVCARQTGELVISGSATFAGHGDV